MLIPKLPSPRDDDFSEGILQTIDLSSYRNEAQEAIAIKLEDADAEIAPVPAGKVGHIVEPEMDLLSKIIMDFNDMFGNINWNDTDNVQRQILAIPEMVSRDKKYQNAMKNSDEQEARTESERALQQVIFQSWLTIWNYLSSSKTIRPLRNGFPIWCLTLHITRKAKSM